jgi:hypothetical protein
MRRSLFLLGALLGACVEMEPSGRPFAPVAVTEPAAPALTPTAPAPAPKGPQGSFDFGADARDPVELGEASSPPAPSPSPDAAGLAGTGLSGTGITGTGLTGSGVALPVPAPSAQQPAPVWDPSMPLPQVSFGVRVLAVVLDVQPPRAMLALPDGREVVVQPGTMLPADGLLVLAIGRDAVQVAKVTPSGFYATVQTDTVQAMYTTAPSAGP